MLEKLFKLKENNTSVRVEIIGGVTTFMTMAYIIALNPNLLTNFAVGTPLWNAVFLATVISAGVGTLLMAFLANKPFALAPGMGLNSYFATVVASIAVAGGALGGLGHCGGECVPDCRRVHDLRVPQGAEGKRDRRAEVREPVNTGKLFQKSILVKEARAAICCPDSFSLSLSKKDDTGYRSFSTMERKKATCVEIIRKCSIFFRF